MNPQWEPSSLVLHTLRVKGQADVASLARATGHAAPEVEAVIAALEVQGQVVPGRGSGWTLTPAGRSHHEQALTAARAECSSRQALSQAYVRFRTLNQPLKEVCTAWQVRDLATGVLNDHADPHYDEAVIRRLKALHSQVLPIVDDLTGLSARFGTYRLRLNEAHARVLAGDQAAFTSPLTDSYHDVWMELHEDLLTTLGIERHEGET